MKQLLTRNELIGHLRNQLLKLEKFNEIYDSGIHSIAQEIAVKLRIIFHHSENNNSKSLLRQLKLDHIKFVDTGDKFNSHNLLAHWGLLILRMTSSIEKNEFIPRFNDLGFQYVGFQNWWENKKILRGMNQKAFTRKTLIQSLANKDGGAHVDSEIDLEYYELSKKNKIGLHKVNSIGERIPLNDPILPSIRQISYETLETFKDMDIEKESKLR
jgi:hypothetical protein